MGIHKEVGGMVMTEQMKQMRTFFIADLHFGHGSCLKSDGRPWDDVDEMDEALIKLWNYKVQEDDCVFVLGDFAYKNKRPIHEYTDRLNGTIHLIRGNHDKRSEEYESCFADVSDYREIVVESHGMKRQVVLSHYFMPFYAWQHHGAIMLHGHTHKTAESSIEEGIKKNLRDLGIPCESYNVGCMWQNYEPQTLEEILARQ